MSTLRLETQNIHDCRILNRMVFHLQPPSPPKKKKEKEKEEGIYDF